MLALPKLYPIVTIQTLSEAKATAGLILASGAELIQIRDKSSDAEVNLSLLAEHCLKLRESLGSTCLIITNDHPQITLKYGLDGVHLGRSDMPLNEARLLLGPDKIIGQSCNTFEHLQEGLNTTANYLGIGPVFHSSTKSGHADEIGIIGLKKIMDKLKPFKNKPVVAIGGIEFTNRGETLGTGVDSVAMSNGILSFCRKISNTLETPLYS